jgi:predicted amidohydrolase
MKVSALQYGPDRSNKNRCLADIVSLCAEVPLGTELLVLPELAASIYNIHDKKAAMAQSESTDGPTFQALSPVARQHNTWVVVGFIEREGEDLYNAALVIDPTGTLISTYRKCLLYEIDERWATPGNADYRVFHTETGSFTVGICMDINDPKFIEWVTQAKPRAIAFPTNWVAEGIPVWSYWAWLLRDSTTTLIAADTWGSEGPVTYAGESVILRNSAILAGARSTGNLLISAQI